MYDVVVIGAGPGGTVLTYQLNKKGFNVLLLEKEKFPREKPCGGGLTIKAYNLLKEIGLTPNDNALEGTASGAYLIHPEVEIKIETNEILAYFVRRYVFDAFLADSVRNIGGELREKEKVIHVAQQEDKVKIKTQKNIYEARIVVGADGATSVVAKDLGYRKFWKDDEYGVVVVSEINKNSEDAKEILKKIHTDLNASLYFDVVKYGYGWFFIKKNFLNIGVGNIISSREDKNVVKSINRFAEVTGITLLKKLQFRGHIIPVGGRKRRVVNGRSLLIGDAAGFVDPLSGEGLYYAMRSGTLASEIIERSLSDSEKELTNNLKKFEKVAWDDFGYDLSLSLKGSHLFYKHTKKFLELTKKIPQMYSYVVDGIIGRKRFRDYRSLIFKLPFILLKSKM
ncbi:MAG: geranylgeranyl reductase family protein [Candidatus Odinarchaeota archaeon]|nr:geranylgeranyl reductase family protein [Candidatus Odinarchaeota archaeon]